MFVASSDVRQIDRLMETSEVDTSSLSSLHGNRYDYLHSDDKKVIEAFSGASFLDDNIDKDDLLPQSLPELPALFDNTFVDNGDPFVDNSEPSQMMTVDSPWNDESTSCFPTSTNPSFAIALPGSSDFEEFNGLPTISRAESPGLELNSIFTVDTDLSDPTAEIGVCGLRNLGNTCFMSAGLQALLSTESLVTYFLNFDIDGSEDEMIGQFSNLVKRYWRGQFSIINPSQFKYVLGKRYAQFRDCSQHDCQEFLALLLDSLNDELLMHIAKHSKVTTSRITPEGLSENEDFPRNNLKICNADTFLPSIDSTISLCEPDSFKIKANGIDMLNGKREMCCDSSSDSKLMDLKRVKLDDSVSSKTELIEADSVGTTIVRKCSQQESIINRIFQGQFESTVTCLKCNYVSVMHEPFMYLSVPLPYATQQQMYITFVSAAYKSPIKYLITVNKQDDIQKIKSELVSLIDDKKCSPDKIVVAEVFNKHISKILSDDHLVRSVDYNNRDLYAFEVADITVSFIKDESVSYVKGDLDIASMDVDTAVPEQGETCTICLECKPDMVHHKDIKDCTCVLCEECIKMSCVHFSGEKDKMDCPVCRVQLDPKVDLIPIDQPPVDKTIRCLTIPIVIKQVEDKGLIGPLALVRVPSVVPVEILYMEMAKLHPYTEPFSLFLVDGQGTMCSRCMWDVHCGGCMVPKTGLFRLRSGDTLAVVFDNDVDENLLETEMHPGSAEQMRSNKPLTIYDCIDAFCQSELLDENNPWWCPCCKKNQCATKTLSISKYPRCLIVYLKRFVFHENWGIKLQDSVLFPLETLVLDADEDAIYDLYACVCHTGSTSMGHYTSYAKHIESEDWYFYNDESAIKTVPGQEDYCNAYILFYKKQGLSDDDADSSEP